jgi:hypothetical protein
MRNDGITDDWNAALADLIFASLLCAARRIPEVDLNNVI